MNKKQIAALPIMEKQKESFVIGFVGTLKPWHGLSHLVEAFADFHIDHADSKLRIVGDGPQKEEILALSERLGIRPR